MEAIDAMLDMWRFQDETHESSCGCQEDDISARFRECDLYVTCEPCIMCGAALSLLGEPWVKSDFLFLLPVWNDPSCFSTVSQTTCDVCLVGLVRISRVAIQPQLEEAHNHKFVSFESRNLAIPRPQT